MRTKYIHGIIISHLKIYFLISFLILQKPNILTLLFYTLSHYFVSSSLIFIFLFNDLSIIYFKILWLVPKKNINKDDFLIFHFIIRNVKKIKYN